MRAALVLLATVASAKGDFRATFELETEGGAESFSVLVHEDWAPIGAARFKELVMEGFYDDTRFFRVIPGFMAQFGLSGKVETNAKWNAKPIMDEPVKQSNKPGYITFAKTGAPNSRTTQLFINFVDNARLDGMGFAPFGAPLSGAADLGMAPRFAAGARLVPPRGAAALRLDFGPAAFPRGPPFDDFGPDDFGPDDFGPDDFEPFGDFPPLRPPRAGLIARPPQLRNTQYLRHGRSRQGLQRDFPSP
jgi:cyclophilin family peptidyl-prolyl cis-trans isomerase